MTELAEHLEVRSELPAQPVSLAEIVAAVEPHIDETLVDGECLKRIVAITKRFPAKASNFFGFERSLGSDDARVDFALGISEHGAAWLRSEGPWPAVADAFERCLEHVATGAIRPWLVFDTSLVKVDEIEPSIYIGVNARESSAASMFVLARKLGASTSRSSKAVARCLEQLPGSVYCVYVGAMRDRCVGTRLSVASLELEELIPYLRRVGWPGDLEAVNALLWRFRSVSSRFGVQLDVGAEVTPYLGLEMVADGQMMSERAASYNLRLLHLLVTESMCSFSERAKLARWPSEIRKATPFLDALLASARTTHIDDSILRSLVAIIHHIKFAFSTNASLKAKAYFGVVRE